MLKKYEMLKSNLRVSHCCKHGVEVLWSVFHSVTKGMEVVCGLKAKSEGKE